MTNYTTFIANPFIHDSRAKVAREIIKAANAGGSFREEGVQNRAAARIVREAAKRGLANPFEAGLIHIA